MPATILDTAPLVSLAFAQREGEVAQSNPLAFWRSHGGVDAAIEALACYDDLLLDGPSVQRNLKTLPELRPLAELCRTLDLDEPAEQEVYRQVQANFVSQVGRAPGESYTQLFWMHIEEWMAAEPGVRRWYPYIRWQDVENELSPGAAAVARELRERLGAHAPSAGAACLLLVRTLYYYQLQLNHSCDLVLHPLKAAYTESSEGVVTVVGLFADLVRAAFVQRKQQWLGGPELSFAIPRLTGVVLKQCGSWQDLPAVIGKVRATRPAADYRTRLRSLRQALSEGNPERARVSLSGLTAAADRWAKELASAEPHKNVRVSVPLVTPAAGSSEIGSAARAFVFMHSS